MSEFACAECGKKLAPEDDYVCVDDNTVMCVAHANSRGKRLLFRKGDGLAVFTPPFHVIKSVARCWVEPLWMAPFEPKRDYHG